MQKDRFHLETYREHEIWYNADTDKFTVELLVDNGWREKARKSLNDCRKAIDEHIKSNFEFKPITCIRKGRWEEGIVVKIESVRADGGLIENIDGKKNTEISRALDHLNGRQINYHEFNHAWVEWKDKVKALRDSQAKEMEELRKLEPQLTPLDLSFVKQIAKI